MAPLRPGIRLDAETPGRNLFENEVVAASSRTVEWAPSVTPTTGPSCTLAASSSCAYHDLSAFRDLNRLHEGRHSTVWSAVCQQTGKTVVIKGYIRESLKPRQLHNVRREISLLRFFRDVGCKGVVGLLAVFEDTAMIYLVFEACMGGDLYAHLVRNRGTIHEEYVVTKVVFPLLSVLQQLHKLHIIHRDIKPENIFLTETGDIALGDFGLAGHKFQDRMTERVGTLDYMAPEVLSIPTHDDQVDTPGHATDGAKTYDEKIDIWAAGVLVYELLVGNPPFEVDDPQETTRLILTGEASKYPVHISHYARDFVAQALTKSPEARPSAEQLLQHAWLRHHFGGKVPDTSAGTTGGVMAASLLKSWLVASWADLSKEDNLKLPPGTARKSVPGSSDGGSSTAVSPGGREGQKQQPHDGSTQRQLSTSLEAEEGEMTRILDRDPEPAGNRLVASQYPSRDSSTGSMDQAVPGERLYVRNDSGASASSGISVASFASLQNMPRSTSINELGEQDELGLVQRSASVCAANISRLPPTAYPTAVASVQLKPVWQSSTPLAGVGSKKTPGKSRFAG
ncbi:hypothetical protein PLESTB_000465600 [Pleodorina starrii]|uniref:Protein kinase domain-containing protein n=1 Tax=Pleodorina starrii TaxID=330485 RepID=A0A9W6BGB3_9CHLO|nr:hypothetical protein PLESTM_000800100 [Pleodorina starrii]GLC51097.1 hypothetical protein PLESTB_000465600 [Pleodorina starrii]GLC63455.1 hypothetical protein PLESTF_000038100 [Pleodorina starrii]